MRISFPRRALALAAALAASSGCAELTNESRATSVGEVHLVRDGQVMVWFAPRVGGGFAMAAHSTVEVEVVPRGANGVPLARGVADSASIRFLDPAVSRWTQTGARTGFIVNGPKGTTIMYVDVFRRGERIWTSGRRGVEVR